MPLLDIIYKSLTSIINYIVYWNNSQNLYGHALTKIDNNSELMTESELIQFLRIPEISNSKDYHNVIAHLKRIRGLPRIHICRKALYPKKAILDWVEKEIDAGK